eukprot:scaffold3426_cov102-Skeletonema_dohrnii-CCMP3373.AAC.2
MFQQQRALCCLLCALMGITIHSTFAFTSSFEPRNNMHITKSNHPTKLYMSSFFADATPPKETAAAVQRDANGSAITVGQKVAVVTHNSIKAHHVPKSSYGSFDSTTKQFIPHDEANKTRKTSCLLLPEGLRGEVITVHDTNSADRPQPVLVKFGADDEERNDGYSLPSAFSMHLSANEIIVVV